MNILLIAAVLYTLAGVAVAIATHASWLRRLDPAAASAPLGFRLLVTPGLIALWPLVLARVLRGTTPSAAPALSGWTATRLIHRAAWIVCPILVVVIVVAALGARR